MARPDRQPPLLAAAGPGRCRADGGPPGRGRAPVRAGTAATAARRQCRAGTGRRRQRAADRAQRCQRGAQAGAAVWPHRSAAAGGLHQRAACRTAQAVCRRPAPVAAHAAARTPRAGAGRR
ncbi:hypothetical protein G6F46_014777 [Rhizopus delemar]|nr:hypothetical protein G6F46_014777 [Rhizopus delemar]